MATRTTEATNTLETFRVNFNSLVDDIGNVTVTNAGDQLNTSGGQSTNIVTDITADDTMSFLLNDNITSLVSLQATKLHPTSGTFVQFSNADDSTNYSIKFVSPGDTNLDFGSTQGFAAAMAVALG